MNIVITAYTVVGVASVACGGCDICRLELARTRGAPLGRRVLAGARIQVQTVVACDMSRQVLLECLGCFIGAPCLNNRSSLTLQANAGVAARTRFPPRHPRTLRIELVFCRATFIFMFIFSVAK